MKRILLTGATGFVGRQVLAKLAARGYEIHAVSSRPSVDLDCSLLPLAREWHTADLVATDRVSEIVHTVRPHILIHLAWLVRSGGYNDTHHRAWREASERLFDDFMRCDGERIVVAGTCFEYDWTHGVCDEMMTPTTPITEYGKCKEQLRRYLQQKCESEGRSWGWARIFFVFGPHEQRERFIADIASGLLKGHKVACTHGRQIRDYLHSEDVADALVRLSESHFDGICNIASGNGVTLRDLAMTIAEKLGRVELLEFGAKAAAPHEPPVIVANVGRLSRQLGWHPAFDLARRLEQTIAWWSEELARAPAL